MDVRKVNNSFDNVSLRRNGKILVVERRKNPESSDTIFLNLTSTRIATYRFEIDPSVLSNFRLQAFLKDKFLQTETLVSLSSVTNINFNITADAASRVADRFMIVFKQAASTNFTTISAIRNVDNSVSINWGIQNERNVSNYGVEQSNDGINFVTITTQAAIANDGSNLTYTKIDGTASKNNNWYRVKANNINSTTKYTAIAMVGPVLTDSTTNSSIIVYPNPITNKKILNIKFTNKIGKYNIQLLSNNGKIIYTENFTITNINELKKFNLSKHITAGHYELLVLASNGQREVIPIVVY
jgi:hypothetical protein